MERCKMKLVKVVSPEAIGAMIGNGVLYDWRCPECGYGVGDTDNYCRGCGSELDWEHQSEKTKNFIKTIEGEKRC